MRYLRILLAIISSSIAVHAFNHPEIQWKTVTTSHFEINYYDKTEQSVYAVWRIAEDAYASLSKLYDYQPVEKIALSLAEYDDFSNGFAEWNDGNILIWLPDSRFELRSNTTWLRNVVTHELTHIFSLEQKRVHQVAAITADLTFTSPNEMYGASEPFSRLSEYPNWVAEGIAQFETEQQNSDCFDARRAMVLRTSVLSHTELTLDEMGNFNHASIGNEKVYNQGFALTRYIAGKIGLEKLRGVFADATAAPVNFFDEFSKVTGQSVSSLYKSWIDSLRNSYTTQYSSLSPNHKVLWSHGDVNLLPKISPNSKIVAWISSGDDDNGRTDLLVATVNKLNSPRRISYAHTSFCFSNASDRIFYVKSRTPNNTGSYFNDLFSYNLTTGREQRITRNGRVYDVCAIPGSNDLLCICYVDNVFGLFRCTTSNGALTKIIPGEAGMPMVNVTVNPKNSREIVFSKVVTGQSQLFRAIITGDSLVPITSGYGQVESPCFAPNGRIYYSADYDGIFNIYSSLPDGSDIVKHTTTTGGYFSPFVASSGTMFASHYQSTGFTVVAITPSAQPFTPLQINRCNFQNLPVPEGSVSIKSRPYHAKYRRSIWEGGISGTINRNNNVLLPKFETIDTTNLNFSVRMMRMTSDALHKKTMLFGAAIGGFQQTADASAGRQSILNKSLLFENNGVSPLSQHTTTNLWKSAISPEKLLTPYTCRSRTMYMMQTGSSTGDSSGKERSFYPVLQPVYQYQNSQFAPTIGLQLSSVLIDFVKPYIMQFSPYMEYQIAREWFCSAEANFYSFALGVTATDIPITLSWSHAGYVNEDFSYNFGDASQMSISFAPTTSWGATTNQTNDTISVKIDGFSSKLSLFHAFPVKKYGAVQLLSSSTLYWYSQPVLDHALLPIDNSKLELLDGASSSYLYSTNRCTIVFPINRTINKGARHYFDALYGSIGYTLVTYVNSSVLENSVGVRSRAVFDPNYMNGSLYLDHLISFDLKLGRYKSYTNFSTITLGCGIQLLRPAFSLSLTSGI